MMVEDYGGELSHESPPERGSVIVVSLPARGGAHSEVGTASKH